MKTGIIAIQMLVRLLGLLLLVLGGLFWTGHALTLVPAHMSIGIAFVIALWALASIALVKAVRRGLAVFLIVWGWVILIFGMMQGQILMGEAHWLIRVLHLVIGLAAIAFAENLGAALKRAAAAGR